MAADVLADVLALVRQVAGCDPAAVAGEKHFFADLGLSSIDAIILGERLEAHFGRPLRFAEGLSDLARAGRDDVTLAEIAAFVENQLAIARPPESGGRQPSEE